VIIDCDANATYAPDERIRGVISSCLESLGNPSSLHRGGQRARAAIEEARASVRRLVGADEKDGIVFTSGASEANNTVVAAVSGVTGPIVSASTEHPCILQPLKRLASQGRTVALVSPQSDGSITSESVAAVVTPDTALVSIMAANNETGVVNPIAEIVAKVRAIAPRALIHTDAAQLLGKGALSMREMGVDLLTISAHKIGALSGVGALCIRDGVHLEPLILGGPQESKLRGGTENVLGISVFGAVADMTASELPARVESMRSVRDSFEERLARAIPDVEFNGAHRDRLPNTSNVYIPGVRADDLIVAMDLERILISSGAACTSGKPEPSHVLLAMGQSEERTRATIRVSFRADLSHDDGVRVVNALTNAVTRMRRMTREG
jgi:cysteine sulfinate desulfinase/cysteine desulfurase-like protein